MKKLDRLGWAAGLVFESYGVRVGIRARQAADLEPLPELFPPQWRLLDSERVDTLYSLLMGGPGPRPGARRFHLLYRDAWRMARALELAEVLTALESDLQQQIAALAPRRVFVHAGVVGWRGKAIVIPGRTLTGKSTLTAALVRAGATYYSDEYAVLDSRGYVHPFARPLLLRQENGAQALRVRAEDLGGCSGTEPLPVGLVVASRFRPGAKWRPRRCTKGQGVLALLANTVLARQKPRMVLAALRRAIPPAEIWRGSRGDATATANLLLDHLEMDLSETTGQARKRGIYVPATA
jgi:hypothetical protein